MKNEKFSKIKNYFYNSKNKKFEFSSYSDEVKSISAISDELQLLETASNIL